MKNNLVFKFIAILLCAASLLGAVGGISGVIALTSGDLYNRTAGELEAERTRLFAESYARALAMQYAGTELGGCPEEAVNAIQNIGSGFQHVYSTFGYRILDAEGTVLSTYREELKDTAPDVLTFPVSGQYTHLISMESESERLRREAEEMAESHRQDGGNVASEVPAEGMPVDQVMFLDSDGKVLYRAEGNRSGHAEGTYYYPNGDSYTEGYNGVHTGYLYHNQNGELVYNSFSEHYPEDFPETEVAEYSFFNSSNGFLLTNHDPNGLGMFYNSNGNLRFVSYFTNNAAEQPVVVAETVPEITSGWTAETIPGEDDRMQLTAPDGTVMEVVLPRETEAVEEAAPTEVTQPAVTEPMTAETIPEVSVPSETAAMETTAVTVPETVPSSASAAPEYMETTAAETVPETVEATQATAAAEETAAAETEPAAVAVAAAEETVPVETEPVLINGKPLDDYQINTEEYWDNEAQEWMTVKYVYVPMPEMVVEVYVDPDSANDAIMYDVLTMVRAYRDYLLPAIGACLLIFAVFAVYLCTAAGRKPRTEEVRAGGLNRIPLDLYFFGGTFAVACICAVGLEGIPRLLEQDFLMGCSVALGIAFLACLIVVAFGFAFVAQIKTPGGFWWRNTFCGHIMRLTATWAVMLENFLAHKGFPFLGRFLKGLWRLTCWLWQMTCKIAVWCYHAAENSLGWCFRKAGQGLRWAGHKLNRFLSLLPLTWQWLGAGLFVVSVLMIGIDAVEDGFDEWMFPVSLLITFGVIFYASHCFGLLSESTKRMSKGDLDTKVEDKLMVGCFKDFAGDLNALADVAVVAAQKQLKSERMKTELITNVSHDIKTPLTSIINYVDLMQKPHTDEEEQQYLEVLDRQSQRLKKLIDDLMDMSKANTGNMQVEITRVDAVESVNQALGEFADKLERAKLMPVFRHDDAQVPMMADGRLVWRVLSNLLSNAVKYAMPGTRLYIDLMSLEGKVVLSLKNISREELNIDAEELMERFVRGDDSRNTEGSGLGLNIAKSLMELQKGQLQLLVDGDLFKITLIFPGA